MRDGLPYYVNEFWTSGQRQAHPLHEVSYRACFKPQLPRFFIDRLSAPGEAVHDPFMGQQYVMAVLKRQRHMLTFTVYPILYNYAGGTYQVTATASGLTSNAAQLTVVCAVPTNFQPYLSPTGYCQANGELDFYYTFSSSTGNQADISACQVWESVTYSPFPPPSPPWPPGGAGYVEPTQNTFPGARPGR